MDIASQVAVKRAAPAAETRIASYLLTDYLERLGVEVVFGLTGHTIIGMPLVNVPAFELDCTWRTMIRLTGAISARRLM